MEVTQNGIPRRRNRPRRLDVDLAMRIATEHVAYRSAVADIESELERVRRGSTPSPARLTRQMRSFERQLERHFALEENGGLFDVYDAHDEAARRHAQEMREEHQTFLGVLARLVRLVEALPSADESVLEAVAAEVRDLVPRLREHERREDALLQRIVGQDIAL